jgi:hypothetical protein
MGLIRKRDDAGALCALVRACAAAEIGRQALLLRLSRLPPGLDRPHHLRLVHAALAPLTEADRARLFRLPNDDVALVWRDKGLGPDGAHLQDGPVQALHHLFSDLPGDIVLLLDLPRDAERLLGAVAASRALPATAVSAAPVAASCAEPLDIGGLSALEAALMGADLGRFVRRRPVCRVAPDGEVRLCWERRHLSLLAVAADLLPGQDAAADPWLLHRLRRTLDERLLALLTDPAELRDAVPFAVELNAASILSTSFLRFDAALPAPLRGAVVLELTPADILADPATFLFARDFAHGRHYRLKLAGVTASLLPALSGSPLSRLGLDLLGVTAAMLDIVSDAPDSLVLEAVESAADLRDGLARGIRLFEGRLIQPDAAFAAA